MMNVQTILDSIESLSKEDRDALFESLRNRRIEQRRAEIVANARQVVRSIEMGTAKSFTNFEDLKSYLLADDEE